MGHTGVADLVFLFGMALVWTPIYASTCGNRYAADVERGYISSPGYPNSYNTSERCVWTMSVPSGYVIRFTFYPPFQLESTYDLLKVTEFSSSSNINKTRTWSGKILPAVYTSSKNQLELLFTSDNSNDGKGFSLFWEKAEINETTCGWISPTNAERGYISSPGYPNRIGGNERCKWTIEVPDGFSIRLTFYQPFDLGQNNKLELYSINNWENHAEIKSFTGSNFPGVYTTITNKLEVWFRAEGSSVAKGFGADWNMLEQNNTGCGWNFPLNAERGSIKSPNYPLNYVDRDQCLWTINVPSSFVVKFTFDTPFNLESGYDYLKLFEPGSSGNWHEKHSWNGNPIPRPYTSESNRVRLTFTTDYSVIQGGFSLMWEKVLPILPCKQDLSGSRGAFSIPNNLDRYDGPDCWWNIRVNQGYFIRIQMRWTTQAHRPTGQEWLEVYDVMGDGSMIQRGRWHRADDPPVLKSFGTRMAVRIPNSKDEAHGLSFHADWRAVFGCGGSLIGGSGYIMSYEYRGYTGYDHTSGIRHCAWDISVPKQPGIVLNIQHAWSESDCNDILQVLEYSPTVGRYVSNGKWCGNDTSADNATTTSTNVTTTSTNVTAHVTSAAQRFRLVYDHNEDYSGGFFASWKSGITCGGKLTADRGSLKSPYFPNEYYANIDCRWEIHADRNHMTKLQFDDNFNVEEGDGDNCVYDYVEIFDTADDGSGNELLISRGRFCGTQPPPALLSYYSPVVVVFHSDGSKNGFGFSLSWNSEETCGGVFIGNQGKLSYPNINASYPAGANCRWEIRGDPWFKKSVLTWETNNANGYNQYDNNQLYIHSNTFSNSFTLGRGLYSRELQSSSFIVTFNPGWYNRLQGFDMSWSVGCGETFSNIKGKLSSPNYGVDYPTNVDCEWKINAPTDHVIHLTFDSLFDIESSNDEKSCSFDYVEVFDSTAFGRFSHGRFCGSQSPPALVSSSNTVTIRFHSDGEKTGKGFGLSWDEACGDVYHSRQGNLSTPHYPLAYPRNFDCRWEIRVPEGYIISLRFKESFDLEDNSKCDADYLETYDYSTTGNLVKKGRWCGKNVPPLQSSTSRMLVVFHSDYKKNYQGFTAEWDSACGDAFNSSSGSFTSPGFPNSYPDNLSCRWEIKVPQGQRVELTFGPTFDIEMDRGECGYDNIEIFDFLPNGALKSSGRWCSVRETPVFHSTSSRMLVTFTSDLDKTGKGFNASWRAVSNCGDTFTSRTGYLLSPNYPNKYPENTMCRWNITPPQKITLHFDPVFDIELSNGCQWDNLQIRLDGYVQSNWCGNNAPRDIDVRGGQTLEVIFHSDNSNSGKGFYATWTNENREKVATTTLSPWQTNATRETNVTSKWSVG